MVEIEVDNIGNLWYEFKNLFFDGTVAGAFGFAGRRRTTGQSSMEKEI